MIQGEELRVLYVALTRACQYLLFQGQEKEQRVWMPLLEKFRRISATMPKMVPVKKSKRNNLNRKKQYL